MLKHAYKYILGTLLFSLILIPPVQSETSYFVTGVEDAVLHGYETGSVYEINICQFF